MLQVRSLSVDGSGPVAIHLDCLTGGGDGTSQPCLL